MNYQTLRLQLDGPAARITLCRPATGNAMDDRCLRELGEAAAEISARESMIVTLITAEGADFCLGWEEKTREERSHAAFDPTDEAAIDPFGCIAGLACPVVAAVQGRASSAGLELALAADLRVCANDARFALPEVSMGLLPLAGGSQRLPRVIGRARAASMLLAGEELDAAGALTAGLVSRVFPAESLAAESEALAGRIAKGGPLALRYAKESLRRGLELGLEQGLRLEADLSVILQTTSDRAEGVRAFIEKREPRFEGS